MTTDWEPVASVPRNRPARYSTYGRRDNSDDDSSESGGCVAPDIQHFRLAGMAQSAETIIPIAATMTIVFPGLHRVDTWFYHFRRRRPASVPRVCRSKGEKSNN